MVVVEREAEEGRKEKCRKVMFGWRGIALRSTLPCSRLFTEAEVIEDAELKKKKGRDAGRLTTADLVLLSLLAERPMHGYQANAELVRREVQDWAGISRPQVYYSLEKLARMGLLRAAADRGEAEGPERQVYAVTQRGTEALANALEREDWSTQRTRPAFLTWMALSWQARRGVFATQLDRRREFLEKELARERETLDSILKEVGHPYHEAVWMVSLMIAEFETELQWLAKVEKEMEQRGKAKHSEYAPT